MRAHREAADCSSSRALVGGFDRRVPVLCDGPLRAPSQKRRDEPEALVPVLCEGRSRRRLDDAAGWVEWGAGESSRRATTGIVGSD